MLYVCIVDICNDYTVSLLTQCFFFYMEWEMGSEMVGKNYLEFDTITKKSL